MRWNTCSTASSHAASKMRCRFCSTPNRIARAAASSCIGWRSRWASGPSASTTAMKLDPMPPRDRRIVHLALKDDPMITTRSAGEGFLRAVEIVPVDGQRERRGSGRENRRDRDRDRGNERPRSRSSVLASASGPPPRDNHRSASKAASSTAKNASSDRSAPRLALTALLRVTKSASRRQFG